MASLAPAAVAKTVYFIRHGLAEHNAALEQHELSAEEVLAEYARRYHDSRLSCQGEEEARALRTIVSQLDPAPEVVVTSTLSRTTATAVLAFEGMRTPIVACELWRERSGRWPCERRRLRSALAVDFPAVDFADVLDEEDALWSEARESGEAAFRRATEAVRYVLRRPERVVAVVSHAGFMSMNVFHKKNAAILDMSPEMRRPFANCELRCVGLVGTSDAASLKLHYTRPSILPRDAAEQAHAAALQHSNMGRLNKLFASSRGESLLVSHRAAFPRIFAADDGSVSASRL